MLSIIFPLGPTLEAFLDIDTADVSVASSSDNNKEQSGRADLLRKQGGYQRATRVGLARQIQPEADKYVRQVSRLCQQLRAEGVPMLRQQPQPC